MSKKNWLPIWDYFEVAEDTKIAKYNTCKKLVSRGWQISKNL